MAAGNFTLYGNAKLSLAQGKMNLASDSIQAILVGASYTPNLSSDSTYANVSADEVTGTGYTAGGSTLTGQTVALSGTTVEFDASAVTWLNSTLTSKYVVLVHKASTGLAPTDLLLGYADLNNAGSTDTVSDTNGTFTVTWNAAGIFTLS